MRNGRSWWAVVDDRGAALLVIVTLALWPEIAVARTAGPQVSSKIFVSRRCRDYTRNETSSGLANGAHGTAPSIDGDAEPAEELRREEPEAIEGEAEFLALHLAEHELDGLQVPAGTTTATWRTPASAAFSWPPPGRVVSASYVQIRKNHSAEAAPVRNRNRPRIPGDRRRAAGHRVRRLRPFFFNSTTRSSRGRSGDDADHMTTLASNAEVRPQRRAGCRVDGGPAVTEHQVRPGVAVGVARKERSVRRAVDDQVPVALHRRRRRRSCQRCCSPTPASSAALYSTRLPSLCMTSE